MGIFISNQATYDYGDGIEYVPDIIGSIGRQEVNDFKVEAPVFNPEAGVALNNGDTVTITNATEGATIYYTIDGTDPSASSAKYEGPIAITADKTTIKAIAVKDDKTNEISTATYTLKEKSNQNP